MTIRKQRFHLTLPAVIALGSNLGDRENTIRDALLEIAAIPGVTLNATSSMFETVALKLDGLDESAPAYVNAVALVSTTLEPQKLLDALSIIENRHGRVRTERWGDRTLDLDIIDIAGIQVDTETLTLPHPRAWERDFVLAPWLELDPDAELVGHGRVDQLLRALHGESR